MVVDCKEEVLVVDNNQLPFLCPYHLFFSRHPNHQGKKEIHHLLKPKNVVSAEQSLIMVSPEMSISLCALLDVFICVYVCGGLCTCKCKILHLVKCGWVLRSCFSWVLTHSWNNSWPSYQSINCSVSILEKNFYKDYL